MDAKLRNFSELYNILSVKSLLRTNLKALLTDWRVAITIIACYVELL